MKLDVNQLPQDTPLLHQLVKDLVDDLHQKQQTIEEQQRQNRQQHLTIEKLQRRLDVLNRHRFGQRSQKIDPSQLALWKQALDEDIAETEQAMGRSSSAQPKKKNNAKRKPLPPSLPRETLTYEHPDGHCHCGHALHRIGVQTCEELHYEPAQFYVLRHEQVKYGCRQCDSITTADKPARPIEKGVLGSSLLAFLLVSKYEDHIPIDRVRRMCERSHIRLPVSTLTDALGRCGWILRPLVERLCEYLKSHTHLHTDDTVIPVIDTALGKTKQGRLWVYLHTGTDGPPAAVFDYTPNRTQQGPLNFLKDFKGHLQADGYPGYDKLYETGEVVEVACWAHVRAKFETVEKRTQSPIAQTALMLISELYAIERDIKTLKHEQRTAERQEHAIPVLKKLNAHLNDSLLAVASNSDVADPIGYALKRWTALTCYCDDGRLHIDNNPAERCIRPITIGRKNWIFAGSDLAAERAAIIYSLIETCKLNQVDPFAYFCDVLARIADHPNQTIDDLLPFNWKPRQKPE